MKKRTRRFVGITTVIAVLLMTFLVTAHVVAGEDHDGDSDRYELSSNHGGSHGERFETENEGETESERMESESGSDDDDGPNVSSLPSLGQTTPQTFTWDQVSLHNTVDNAWIVVGTNVYDVTDYLARHPGGSVFTLGADNTRAYRDAHGTDTSQLARYRIGTLAGQ